MEYSIKELCDRTGLPRRTIHFYTQQGILPPPEGSGGGAWYTEVHLLRLRAIPVLRRQGLRLDDIRQRLEGMDNHSLKQITDSAVPEALDSARAMRGQSYLHYALPGGILVAVPNNLAPSVRQKVTQLLEYAVSLLGHD